MSDRKKPTRVKTVQHGIVNNKEGKMFGVKNVSSMKLGRNS
jgi:hypothetical protein